MLKNLLTIGIACLLVERSLQQLSFEEDCVRAHNKYRRLHVGTPDLVLDKSISRHAQEWADRLADEDIFEHRPNNEYGENLYASWGSPEIDCYAAVVSWYSEIGDYDFNNPGIDMNTGHFTQLVWRSTKRVGCGFAGRGPKVIIVCDYDPFGNLMGAFKQNVMREK